MSFHLTTSEHEKATVVTVTGELDIATAPQLADALYAARSAQPDRTLVIDLSPTTFLDSSGLRALANAARDEGGAGLALVCPSANAPVHRVVELTGFDRLLVLHERLADLGLDDVA